MEKVCKFAKLDLFIGKAIFEEVYAIIICSIYSSDNNH